MITKIIKDGSKLELAMYLDDEQTKVGYILAEIETSNIISANSTVVNEEFKGQKIAGKLVEQLIGFARKNNYKIKPVCSYIQHYFSKNEESLKEYYLIDFLIFSLSKFNCDFKSLKEANLVSSLIFLTNSNLTFLLYIS